MSGSARIVRIAEVSDGFCGWPVPVVGVGLVHKCFTEQTQKPCVSIGFGWLGCGGLPSTLLGFEAAALRRRPRCGGVAPARIASPLVVWWWVLLSLHLGGGVWCLICG